MITYLIYFKCFFFNFFNRHSRIIYKLKTDYKVENYSIYQRKKTKQQIIGLSLAMFVYICIFKY